MLSIIVTYYNQEQYVSRSLDSIFAQNLSEEFEILVGDDGSQDNTCSIIKEYQKSYPNKIILNIQPRDCSIKYNPIERASKNRLDLLKMAKGDYVCFLDGDDEYCDFTWMQKSIDILKNNNKLAGVAHNYCEKYPDGKIITPSGIGQHSLITAKLYAKKLYTPAGTIVFKNFFNLSDYRKLIKLKTFDDNDITFYFLNFGDLCCENNVVYTYYQNYDSIWNSANKFEKNLINAIDYEIIKEFFKKYHISLMYKYFYSYYYIYKNKKELSNEKYFKYINQCLDNGFIYKLFKWNEISFINKVYIFIYFNFFNIIYLFLKIQNKVCKIISK